MFQARDAGIRARPRGNTGPIGIVALVLIAVLAAGCAPVVRPPSPSPARPHPGYDRRVDRLDAVDMSALAGRRVVLDPGHGGYFRGALGVNGLTEAEVNLGVALHLRGLLEARGGEVYLTRGDDRDFLSAQDSSLRGDLAERTRIANRHEPDLFVSIHHNADAGGSNDRNEIQTYYKLGDEGPSLDAAQRVHRYLVRNLGIAAHRILPGNYFVLRNSNAPALLTESSYITNPDVESKLALAAKQRLEAEALLLGIAAFFARRAPVIARFEAVAAPGATGDTLFREIASPALQASIEGPFDDATLTLDGRHAPLEVHGRRLTWRPREPIAPGLHAASLRVRMSGEGAAPERTLHFRIVRPVLSLAARAVPSRTAGGWVGVRIDARDAFGFTVPDTLLARVSSQWSCDPLRETEVALRAGVGWAYLNVAAPGARPAEARDRANVVVSLADGGPTTRLAIPVEARAHHATGFLRRAPEDRSLLDAPGSIDAQGASAWVNRDGFACIELDPRPAAAPRLSGYRPLASDADPVLPLRWAPIAAGALHGRRITLDPDGGGDAAAGTGKSGTRAANLNLEVARALAAFLRAAGAEVVLTREGDFALSDVERVQISEAFRADRYLRIGHRGEPPRLGHYYSSAGGRAWAERTARAFARLGLAAPGIAPDPQYPLQQTSCPALYASAARVDDPAAEERLQGPGGVRAEAYALFLGLAREWAPDAEWPLDSLTVRDAADRPVAGAIVTLGDALALETDAAGRLRFARTEPGPLAVETDLGGIRHRTILLDSMRGAVVGGRQAP